MRQTRRMDVGERMMIPCRGGPVGWRAARFPPPLDTEVGGGLYVLVDDGSPHHRMYEFVAIGADA